MPKEKKISKIVGTIKGSGWLAGGVSLFIWVPQVPWWAALGVCVIGATMISGDLLRAAGGTVKAVGKDFGSGIKSVKTSISD